MFERINAIQWTCDGCDKTEMRPLPDQIGSPSQGVVHSTIPDGWIEGKAVMGPFEAEWHAHAQACVGKAVKARLEQATGSGSTNEDPDAREEGAA